MAHQSLPTLHWLNQLAGFRPDGCKSVAHQGNRSAVLTHDKASMVTHQIRVLVLASYFPETAGSSAVLGCVSAEH